MEQKTQFNIWYFIAAFFLLLLFQSWWAEYRQVETIAFSRFEQDLAAGRIESVVVRGDYITGTYSEPRASGKTQFITHRVPADLAERLSRDSLSRRGDLIS